ncbi:MAG: HAD family hydrolase [Pseudothermotoga sp.]
MRLFMFDVGGVVCENISVVPMICEHLGISRSEFLSIADQSGLKEIQTGAITVEKFWAEFSRISGIVVVEDLWEKYFHPTLNTQTVQIINHLKKAYRVVAATNTIESHYRVHSTRSDYKFFDRVYASHLIGYMKPDPQFYIHILKQEEVTPTQVVFVDDTNENVEAASNLGIQSILFTNAQELWQKLFDLQLLPNR